MPIGSMRGPNDPNVEAPNPGVSDEKQRKGKDKSEKKEKEKKEKKNKSEKKDSDKKKHSKTDKNEDKVPINEL